MRRVLFPGTDKIMHAALAIGDSKLFLSDRSMQKKDPKGIGSAFYVYVADVDAAHKRAIAAGMSEMMPPADMFWGDRMSAVNDRFGHRWCFATHTREVGEDEMRKAMQQQFEAAKNAPKRVAKKSNAQKKNQKKKR